MSAASMQHVRPALRIRWWRPTWPRLRLWQEALIIGICYLFYEIVRYYSPGDAGQAMANARGLIGLEKALHINFEVSANHWMLGHRTLTVICGYYYATLHFAATLTTLGLLWWRRPRIYPWLRSALLLLTAASLVIYWRYPVAPPRFADKGMTDILAQHSYFIIGDPHGVSSLIDQNAAMPSLHIGWAIWVAAAIVISIGSPWRHLAWLYPALTTAIVITTANHYVLDGVVSSGMLAVALVITRPVGQRGLSAVDRHYRDGETTGPNGVINLPDTAAGVSEGRQRESLEEIAETARDPQVARAPQVARQFNVEESLSEPQGEQQLNAEQRNDRHHSASA